MKRFFLLFFMSFFICTQLISMQQDIFSAASECDVAQLKMLIDEHTVNSNHKCGHSLLLHAIHGAYRHTRYADFEKTVALFKQYHVDFNNCSNKNSMSALAFAAVLSLKHETKEVVAILCKAGANPFVHDASIQCCVWDMIFAFSVDPKENPYAGKIVHELQKHTALFAIDKR